MQKLKWKYDAKNKYWWTPETVSYAGNGFSIKPVDDAYVLKHDYFKTIGYFHKLKHAKLVAQLLRHG